MTIPSRILSDEALRNVQTGSAKPAGQLTASELPPMAASWGTTVRNPVGEWKDEVPFYIRGLSPCLVHCPVGNDVEGFVSKLRDGDEQEAARILRSETPLAACCGRVCYHPCETGCNRTQMDGAVGIRGIERYLADVKTSDGVFPSHATRESTGKRIAIVGSGPGGLTCAWASTLLGHSVTIFESAPEPGGLLRYGIPAYRLPREVLHAEIENLKRLGVKIQCNSRIGTDRSISDLLAEYDVVFLAVGATASRALGIPGESSARVFSALEYLQQIASGSTPEIGQRCVVIGGGNSAIDAARSARRMGSEATIVYRRSRSEMPAHHAEISDALAENVALIEQAFPISIQLENGHLVGVKCLRTQLGEPDASGRRSPVPIPDSEFILPADSLINALGEQVDVDSLVQEIHLRSAISNVSMWRESTHPGLFAGGDFAGAERTVAHAMGDGKRAALAIDCYLRNDLQSLEKYRVGGGPVSLTAYLNKGESEIIADGIHTISSEEINYSYFRRKAVGHPEREIEQQPSNTFDEVEHGYTQQQALREASRCFSCGRCTRCGLCQIFCPEGAVRVDSTSGDLFIFDDHCKGCGICVEECPRSAIQMKSTERT